MSRLSSSLLIAFLFLFAAEGPCQADEGPLTLSVRTIGSGSITISPEKEVYALGEKVVLNADPSEGFLFSSWLGAPAVRFLRDQTSIELEMRESLQLVASFLPQSDSQVQFISSGPAPLEPVLNEDSARSEWGTYFLKPSSLSTSSTHPASLEAIITGPRVLSVGASIDEGLSFQLNGIEQTPYRDQYLSEPNLDQFIYIIPKGRFLITLKISDPAQTIYNITIPEAVTVDTSASSDISLIPDKEIYSIGEIVTIEAQDNYSENFLYWSGDLQGHPKRTQVTLDDHMVLAPVYSNTSWIKNETWRTGQGNAAYVLERNYTGKQYWSWKASEHQNGTSWLEVDIEGPGQLYIEGDGGETVTLDGTLTKGPFFAIKSGLHTLRWETQKKEDTSAGTSYSLSNLEFTPGLSLLTGPSRGGFTEVWPYKSIYGKNDSVNLRATPDEGFTFVAWSGDYQSIEKTVTIDLQDSTTIIPIFENTGLINSFPWEGTSKKAWKVDSIPESDTPALYISGPPVNTDSPVNISIEGPGSLSFEAYSSVAHSAFLLNNTQLFQYSRYDTDWATKEVLLEEGVNILTIVAKRDQYDADGALVGIRNLILSPGFDLTYPENVKGGTLAVNLENGQHAKGTPVTILATPSEGNHFSGWSDPTLPNSPELTVSLDRNLVLSPVFQANELPIASKNVQITGEGNWFFHEGSLQNQGDATYSFEVEGPSVLSLTLEKPENAETRASGYITIDEGFPYFISADSSQESEVNYTIQIPDGPHKIQITPQESDYYGPQYLVLKDFLLEPGYLLKINPSSNGTIEASSELRVFALDQEVILTATPSPGFSLFQWSIQSHDGSTQTSKENPIVIKMDSDKSVYASFAYQSEDQQFLISGSQVNISESAENVQVGEKVTLVEGASNGLSFVLPIENTYPVTVSFLAKLETGSLYYYDYSKFEYVTIESSQDWKRYDILLREGSTPSPEYFEFFLKPLDGNLKVLFDDFQVLNKGPISLKATNGTATISPEREAYSIGDLVTLTATPSEGYAFQGWQGGVTSNENPATVSIEKIQDIYAVFTKPTQAFGYTWQLSGPEAWDVNEQENAISTTIDAEQFSFAKVELNGPGEVRFHSVYSSNSYNENLQIILDGETLQELHGYTGIWFSQDHRIPVGPGKHIFEIPFSANAKLPYYYDSTATLTISDFSVSSAYTIDLETFGLQVERSPDKELYQYGDEVTLTLKSPDAEFIGWTGDFEGMGSELTLVMDRSYSATLLAKTTIDYGNLKLTTQGPYPWSLEDGRLKSGRASTSSKGQLSTLETTVTGPGTLKIDWENIQGIKSGKAVFEVLLDGEPLLRDDTHPRGMLFQNELLIPSGVHSLKFVFKIWNGGTETFHESFYATINSLSFHPAQSERERTMIQRAIVVFGIHDILNDTGRSQLRLAEESDVSEILADKVRDQNLWGYSFEELPSGEIQIKLWCRTPEPGLQYSFASSNDLNVWTELTESGDLDDQGTEDTSDDLTTYTLVQSKSGLPRFFRYSIWIEN